MKRLLLGSMVVMGLSLGLASWACAQNKTTPAQFPKVPAFKAKQWLQGSATTLNSKDTVYIVELWATWCGPCKKSLPALAALQKKYPRSQLHAVALTEDDVGAVRRYLGKNKTLKPLSVVVDPLVYQKYMKRFKVRGIPMALLVQNGRLLWKGHPGSMKPVLGMILKGRWDPNAMARAEAFKRKAAAVEAHWKLGGPMTPEAKADGEHLIKHGQDHPMVLNNVAWIMLTEVAPEKRPTALALSIAKAANDAAEGQDFNVLDTYARALYLSGDADGAKAAQGKAVRLCQAAGGDCAGLRQILSVYKAGGVLSP